MKYNENSPEERKSGLTEEEINSPEFNPEEFAPAPEKNILPSGEKKYSSVLFGAICAVFAVILALVGAFSTFDAAKSEKAREDLVLSNFKYCTKAVFVKSTDGCDVYAVYYKEKVAGVGVYRTVKGFAGNIEILVSMGGANEITDVSVICENESAGLGDKIRDEEFLEQFNGLTAYDEKTQIDLVSRATASSDAVVGGVKFILESGINTFSVAKELKAETITAEEIAKDVNNNGSDAEETTGDAEETTGKENGGFTVPDFDDSDGRELDGQGGNGNSNNGGGNMSVDGEDVTTVYETESEDTTASDTTASRPQTTKPSEVTDKPAPDTEPPVTETQPPETEEPVTDEPVVTDAPDTGDTGEADTTAPDSVSEG